MLENRLNVLLAERRLKIKDVMAGTGLSRNTISRIVNNPTVNISTKCLESLMMFLGVGPGEFWVFRPNHCELSARYLKGGIIDGKTIKAINARSLGN